MAGLERAPVASSVTTRPPSMSGHAIGPIAKGMVPARPMIVDTIILAKHRGAAAMRRQPIFALNPSDLQHLGARRCFEFAGVDCHRQQAVVADRAGKLDEPLITEPSAQRAGTRLVDAVPAEKLPGEFHDLGVFGGNAA